MTRVLLVGAIVLAHAGAGLVAGALMSCGHYAGSVVVILAAIGISAVARQVAGGR